jgi:hypothetical protein
MQRYNIFHQIHKGLRAMLYETAIKVQHADFWNVDETEDTIENINEVVRLFDMHAFHEDNHVFPAVEKYDPAIADAFEQEHVQDHLLGELLSNSIERWKSASIITEKAEIAREIQYAYVKFMVFNLEHMAKEEDVLNKILWRYYTDPELMAITGQIISEVPTDYVGKYNKWMMRGLNNAEITRWLKGVERNAPEYVFRSLFTTAERELPERRFRLVLEGLTEGVMLA